MKNKISFIIISVLLILLVNRCSIYTYQSARNFIASDSTESVGFGLYSYILFSQEPDSNLMGKYKSIIEAYLNKVPLLERLEKYLPKEKINIIYCPLSQSIPSDFYRLKKVEQIDWIIKHYDYARAKFYLSKFDVQLMKGPYIISYKKPLTLASNISDKYLIQDFTYVHQRVAALWMDEFLTQSKKKEYWDNENLNNFSNDLRNAIAIAADGLSEVGESITWWTESLKKWIEIK